MLEHFLDRENRARRNALAIEHFDPLLGGMRSERAIYFLGERGAIFHAAAAALESFVTGQFRPAN